jgi:hypothetical protein
LIVEVDTNYSCLTSLRLRWNRANLHPGWGACSHLAP